MDKPITDIPLQLVGQDGNAYFILARAHKALREGGRSDLWEEFYKKATSSDYNNLLCTCMDYFVVDADEEDEDDE